MTQLILHHYPTSPFAEKVRLIMGFKALQWHSVHIPSLMPKPDVVALTGGYRKTPILQVGADVFCDTSLIAEELEARHGAPSLYPVGVAAASRTLAQWADSTLFWTMIPFTMQPAGLAAIFDRMPPEAIKAFSEDRQIFRANVPRMRVADAVAAFTIYLQRLTEMLGAQPYFFGAHPSIADFSIYHNLWYVLRGGPVATIFEQYPSLAQFRERMRTFGYGQSEKLDSAAAIQIAHDAVPNPSTGISHDAQGLALGERVIAAATDTGVDPIEGSLYGLSRDRISIARQDPRAGNVVVHFPRLGFELRRAK
jgi:glutathione S-transferase